ncbi:MAG: archaeal heat shock protein Hsp20 [Promethearchaeota archaeon]
MGKKKKKIHTPFDDEGDEFDDDDMGNFNPFGDNMGDFLNEFMKKIQNMMKSKDFFNFSKNVFKQFGFAPEDINSAKMKGQPTKSPFVYGFSVKFGKDGKPIIDKFGNIKPPKIEEEPEIESNQFMGNVREPIADIIEQEQEILVVVELPGVHKEDIELMATDYTLEVRAADSDGYRRYQKRLELPSKINPDIAKARYTNGILEIRLTKVEEKSRGSPIKIE